MSRSGTPPARVYRSGGQGSFCELTAAAPHMVDVGDETWLYVGGVGGVSTENRDSYALGLGKLRRRGFVSVGTNDLHQGMLLTEACIAPGERLVINAARGPQGHIKVEAADVTYTVMPGRSAAECDVFTGDSIEHVVTWGGDPTLPLPEGTDSGTVYPRFIPHRRLRFYIARCAALPVSDDELGRLIRARRIKACHGRSWVPS